MSKRNVAFVKPPEPSFLKKLKQDIGYVESPTVDTKREKSAELSGEEDNEERLDEQPQVVVINPGDLNAEEFAKVKKKQEEEKNTKPADLNQRVIFRSKPKPDAVGDTKLGNSCSTRSGSRNPGKESLKSKLKPNFDKSGSKLSFNVEEEEDEIDD